MVKISKKLNFSILKTDKINNKIIIEKLKIVLFYIFNYSFLL